ncbi:guanine-N(7)--methyltransferase subunit TRM82 [Phaeosphaeria sp. MPI-PUGE-AT-0046c]|nr:guanine-N(7)--methyltransferase subunit TRM82 [Phaeosphaeria sp. MPI-PUGE-AT-0046c]
MKFPFQCLVARAGSDENSGTWTLFGASGSKIVLQSSDGTTSVWPQQVAQAVGVQEDEQQEPPGKRIKLSAPPQERQYNISSLILSSDGKYLVGVTGEDKCIRVFEINPASGLQQLSARCMSRKPSSITLTSDDSTILCADKFGDVYALPLLPGPDDERLDAATAPETLEPEEKEFTPSATVLTVHSGRNRKTLEDQLKQKAKGPAKPKEAITFRHDLLLGHVSMLTDLAFASVDGRGYIITADRDEHIRVSRGMPQAHIIEGFCFGHEEFVSKLCLTQSGMLISGGGDTHLFAWDWQNYRLLEKLALRDTVNQFLKTRPEVSDSKNDETLRVAVSGIWDVPNSHDEDEILVACEGVPALFSFSLGKRATPDSSLPLHGNVLDVAFLKPSHGLCTIVVSVDNVHQPGSTTARRVETDAPRLQYFSRQASGLWCEDTETIGSLGSFAEQGSEVAIGSSDGSADNKAVRDILYHVENLRKRPGGED